MSIEEIRQTIKSKIRKIHGQDCEIKIHQPLNALVDEYRVVDSQARKFSYFLPDALIILNNDLAETLDTLLLMGKRNFYSLGRI